MKSEENLEEKLIIAKLEDKIKLCRTSNKIVNTGFLNTYEKNIIQNRLNQIKEKNYIFFGGYEEAQLQILVIYPQKMEAELVYNNMKNLIKVINIKLPKELYGKYEHSNYLSAVMKQGLEKARIGDIIVHKDEAYILILQENAEYLKNCLKSLKRFNKAKISIVQINEIKVKEQEFKDILIKVASNRIDSIISEVSKTSRNKSEELIDSKRVFINYKQETKYTRMLKENDVIVIRGKGKFIIDSIQQKTPKGKIPIKLRQYK